MPKTLNGDIYKDVADNVLSEVSPAYNVGKSVKEGTVREDFKQYSPALQAYDYAKENSDEIKESAKFVSPGVAAYEGGKSLAAKNDLEAHANKPRTDKAPMETKYMSDELKEKVDKSMNDKVEFVTGTVGAVPAALSGNPAGWVGGIAQGIVAEGKLIRSEAQDTLNVAQLMKEQKGLGLKERVEAQNEFAKYQLNSFVDAAKGHGEELKQVFGDGVKSAAQYASGSDNEKVSNVANDVTNLMNADSNEAKIKACLETAANLKSSSNEPSYEMGR